MTYSVERHIKELKRSAKAGSEVILGAIRIGIDGSKRRDIARGQLATACLYDYRLGLTADRQGRTESLENMDAWEKALTNGTPEERERYEEYGERFDDAMSPLYHAWAWAQLGRRIRLPRRVITEANVAIDPIIRQGMQDLEFGNNYITILNLGSGALTAKRADILTEALESKW